MSNFHKIEIPLALDAFGEEENNAVLEVLKSGQLTMGQNVDRFEEEFAHYFKVKNAIMVNSGSSANLLALEVIRRGRRAKTFSNSQLIAVPAVLWPTTLWPIVQLGYTPLLIDTVPNSLAMDLTQLAEAKHKYKEKLVGAIVIHPLGESLNLTQLRSLQENDSMFIIEDNCESMGAGTSDQYAGTAGDFGTFSFYFSHHITTVEGGMVVTNSDEDANDLRSMRSHGWTRHRKDREYWHQKFPELSPDFMFVTSGYNFRPMEFQAAIGRVQLRKLDSFLEIRQKNAVQIGKALQRNPKFELIGFDESQKNRSPRANSWMALPIRALGGQNEAEQARQVLSKSGIASRPLLAGDFLNQPVSRTFEFETYSELANSRNLYKTSFMVGNHHGFSSDQVEHLCETLEKLNLE